MDIINEVYRQRSIKHRADQEPKFLIVNNYTMREIERTHYDSSAYYNDRSGKAEYMGMQIAVIPDNRDQSIYLQVAS